MPRVALETLIALQQALPGTVLGPEEARPFLSAQILPTIDLPKVLVPTAVPPPGVTQGSCYFNFSEVRGFNVAQGTRILTVLAGGLWKLSGSMQCQYINTSAIAHDRLYLIQEGVFSFITGLARIPTVANVQFSTNVLLRDDAEFGILYQITDADDTVNMSVFLQCEKIL